MRLFYRITGYFITLSFVGAVVYTTIKESIKDITYLWWLLVAYGVAGIFLFGVYLVLKSYSMKKPVKPVKRNTCTTCRFNDGSYCTVGTYLAEQGKKGICYDGNLWESV